jgi:hypothetical protein
VRNQNSPKIFILSIIVLLLAATIACSAATSAVPTPAALPTYTPYPTYTPLPLPSSSNGDRLSANENETAFINELGNTIANNGWDVSEVDENSILISDSITKYLISYTYLSSKTSRIVVLSLWGGMGQQNLSHEALKKVNQLNVDYNFATISIDSDGDVWLTTSYPFGQQMDVKEFIDFIEWFQDTEDYFINEFLVGEFISE